jgi:hypothetical protein
MWNLIDFWQLRTTCGVICRWLVGMVASGHAHHQVQLLKPTASTGADANPKTRCVFDRTGLNPSNFHHLQQAKSRVGHVAGGQMINLKLGKVSSSEAKTGKSLHGKNYG